jgi:hypothetical protein
MQFHESKPVEGCYDTFPAFECCPAPVCCPQQCCPPKTRLNTCMRLKYGMKEVSFLLSAWPCEPEVIPAHLHCWKVDIRRRGECTVRARMVPIRADIDGRAWFALPDDFWLLGEFTYEFDFYMDGKCLLTQCVNVVGVRAHVSEIGFSRPAIYCEPPKCAPAIEETDTPAPGALLSGDCDAEC